MEEQHELRSPRRMVQVLAVAALIALVAALAIWAGSQSAIAAGTPAATPATMPVQAQSQDEEAPGGRGDCPEHDGAGAQDGAGTDGTAL